ncbi:MAG: hypothetical protein Q4A71_03080 [Actinomycetaceae bacterium]|nr:hypothetical protein [Actinomycetaceae bacterium]
MLTRFHTDCDCQIVPSFEKKAAHLSGYDPDAMFAVYKPAYAAAKAKHGGRAGESETAAMIREMFPDKVTDGKGRKRRSAYTPKKVARGASADGTMQVQKMVEYREFAERLLRERGLHESGRYRLPPEVPAEPPKDWPGDLPRLRAKEWNHILYGDIKRSGGHQYGYGWVNNRPEFPAHWSDQDIAQAIIAVLRKEEKVPGKRFLYSSRYGEESITVAVRAKGGVPIVRSAYVQGSR